VSPDDKTLITLGLIIKPRGLSGELVVRPFNEDNPSLRKNLPVLIQTKTQSFPLIVEYVKKAGRHFGVKFEGVNDIDQAEALRGGEILTELENLPPRKKNEFYVFDLIGLDVIDSTDVIFGKVREILSQPANDVLVVDSAEGEVLIPFIRDVIDAVDLQKKQIKIGRVREFLL